MPVQSALSLLHLRRQGIAHIRVVQGIKRLSRLIHELLTDLHRSVETLYLSRRRGQVPIRRPATGLLVEHLPRLNDRRQLVRHTEHAEQIRHLPTDELRHSTRGHVRPRARLVLRHLTGVTRRRIQAGVRCGLVTDRAEVHHRRVRRHQPFHALHTGELPRMDRQVRVIGVLRMSRGRRTATDLTVTPGATHLDVRAIREGPRRVPTARATVFPAHPQVAVATTPELETHPEECLTLVAGGEPFRERRQPNSEPGNSRHRRTAVTPVDAAEDVRGTLKRSRLAMIRPVVNKVQQFPSVPPPAIGVTGKLREHARVDGGQFTVVLLRRPTVNNPLASIQTSSGDHVAVKRSEPVRGLSARSGGRKPVTVMATASEPRQRTSTIPRATGSIVAATDHVTETLIDRVEHNPHGLHTGDRVQPPLRLTNSLPSLRVIGTDLRLRMRIPQMIQTTLRLTDSALRLTILSHDDRQRISGVQMIKTALGLPDLSLSIPIDRENVRDRRRVIQTPEQSLSVPDTGQRNLVVYPDTRGAFLLVDPINMNPKALKFALALFAAADLDRDINPDTGLTQLVGDRNEVRLRLLDTAQRHHRGDGLRGKAHRVEQTIPVDTCSFRLNPQRFKFRLHPLEQPERIPALRCDTHQLVLHRRQGIVETVRVGVEQVQRPVRLLEYTTELVSGERRT